MSRVIRARRVPPLALAAWVLAAGALLALTASVAHYLGSSSGRDMTGMGSSGGHVGQALYRGGSDPMQPLLSGALIGKWQLDSVALAVLVLVAAAYLTGVALVTVRHPGAQWPVRRTLAFLGGLAVCAYATSGSIAVYDQVLFTAHMIGHLALVMLAPALLMSGQPLSLMLAAAREPRSARIAAIARGRVVSLLTAPPVVLAAYTVTIVGTHLTGLMDIFMRSTWAGQVEHLLYVVVGCQFFSLVVGDQPIRWRLSSLTRGFLLLVAMAVDTFTGIVLLQGTRPIGMRSAAGLHVDRLSDTHTGGAIMWFGGDAIMAAVLIAVAIGWLRRVDASEEEGWLEQARRATFSEHTGAQVSQSAARFDDDDEARHSYNTWLARLDRRP